MCSNEEFGDEVGGVNEEQVGGIGEKPRRYSQNPERRALLLPGSPSRRSQAGNALDGHIGDTRQDGGQVATDRNLHPAAGLYYRQDRRHLRAGLLAAYVN